MTISRASALREPQLASFVRDLVRRVEERWRPHGFDERALPDVAVRALEEERPWDRVSGIEVLSWAARSALPPQLDTAGTFGDPPLTLHHGRRLAVDVYAWFSSTTTIHQHGFSGAFCVLSGSSVHSLYGFEREARCGARLLVGELAHRTSELLRRADVRPIAGGDALIHSLFHLDHPSFSIVVRTPEDPDVGPQFQYLRGGVAFDPFHDPTALRRPVEALTALLRIDDAAYVDAARSFLDHEDAFAAHYLLTRQLGLLAARPSVRAGIEAHVVALHGGIGERIVRTLDDRLRTHRLTELRRHVRRADHRLLLALLLAVPTREAIFRLLAEAMPGTKPAELVGTWLRELAQDGRLGFQLDDTQWAVLDARLGAEDDTAALRVLDEEFEFDDRERDHLKVKEFLRRLSAQPLVGVLV